MFTRKYFKDISLISSKIDTVEIDKLVISLKKIRDNKGRIFF